MQQLNAMPVGCGQQIDSPSPWMSTESAAAYLACQPGSLKTWRSLEKGPRYYVISRKLIRYHIDDLSAFVRGEHLDAPRRIAPTQ